MPELFDYQRDGVHFLHACTAAHGAALLADETGTGKTPQLICAPPLDAPVIFVVPAALKDQTAERIIQWQRRARVRVHDGIGDFIPPAAGEWLVCNPDVLPATRGEVAAAERAIEEAEEQADGVLPLDAGRTIDVGTATARRARLAKRGTIARDDFAAGTWLLVDEAHEFNNWKSAQTKRMRGTVAAVRASGGCVVAATATPLLNEPSELRSVLATFGLGGAAWPAKKGRALDYWSFLRDWGGSKGRFGEEWSGEPNDARIAEALRRVMIRRLFRDVVVTPGIAPVQRIEVDLDAAVRALADDTDAKLRERIGDLRAGETRIVFELASKVRAALAVAKLPAAHEWCARMEQRGEPAVVACVSADVVKSIGRRPGWARIAGDVSSADRADVVRRFQRGDLAGVALTHRAGGVGIDLFRSAHLLVVSREWNPALNRQTLARLHRNGQTRRVELTMLMARHAVEQRIDELMGRRKRLMQAIDAAAVRMVAA